MRKNKGNSTAIVVLIILVISAAIIYFIWAGKGTTGTPVAQDKTTREIQTQGTSTEVSAIESDLNATSFTSIDSDLSDIEKELNTALAE